MGYSGVLNLDKVMNIVNLNSIEPFLRNFIEKGSIIMHRMDLIFTLQLKEFIAHNIYWYELNPEWTAM